MENLGPFLGHLHPVLVHLPIGIFLLLGILEASGLASRLRGLSWLPSVTRGQRTLILSIGAAASVLTAAMGWLLARSGDYDAALVNGHRWLGVATAAAAVVLLAISRWRRLYGPALVLTLVLLVVAGDAGGRITHGNDYLTSRMPRSIGRLLGISAAPADKTIPFDKAAAFADVVQPILRDRCVSCHGAAKSNGGLRLDSWEMLAKGGKHGPVLKAGNLAASPLLLRIDLPSDSKEHMPPLGKPQLADDDLTVLDWWVLAGAPTDKPVASLALPPVVSEILEARLGGAAATPPPDRAATLAAAAQIAGKLGIMVRALSPDGPWIEVNARPAGAAFGDRELALLSPVAPAVQWLDLGTTAVTDKGLAALAPMRALQRLHLDQTQVTDAGLARLSGLRRIEYLNLRGTAVTDKGLPALRSLPRLRSLYVWQTAVTPEAAKALGETLVDARRVARWKSEQAELERQVQAERFDGNTGESLKAEPPPPPPNPPPKAPEKPGQTP